jgi:hypothetical protein
MARNFDRWNREAVPNVLRLVAILSFRPDWALLAMFAFLRRWSCHGPQKRPICPSVWLCAAEFPRF